MQKKGRRYSSIHTIRGVVRPAFQMAFEDDIIDKNPVAFELTAVLVNDSESREALTRTQERIFMEFIKNDEYYSRYYDIVYVTIKNMRDNNVYLDDKCDKVDDEAIEKINKRSNLEIGDILFSGIGTMGRVYLVCIPTDNWNVSESVFTLRANKKISKELLYLLLLSDNMQNYCDLNAHGAAQRGIRMADLKAYRFNLPTKELIDRFTSLVTPFINRVQKLRHENLLLQESRDRLLPQLMSGEIDV